MPSSFLPFLFCRASPSRADAIFRFRSHCRLQASLRRVDEPAQVWSRFARIDNFLDAKGLRRAHRRSHGPEPGLNFLLAHLGIGRTFYLAAESCSHAALDGQRAPFGGWP